jgi:hypothetical protein
MMMTLHQIAEHAIDAADAGDLDALKRALKDRAAAIAEAVARDPSEEQAVSLRTAIEDGKVIDAALVALNLRLKFERGQLSQLKSGLIAGLGSPFDPHIDYRG